MLNVLVSFITEADVLVSELVCDIIGVTLNCDRCFIWETSFNASFSAKSDISSYFFQRILFQTQAVLSNSLMFYFFGTDVLLYCHEFDCRPSIIISEKLCSLLSFCELLWFVVCQVLSGCNLEAILHQTTAFSWSD